MINMESCCNICMDLKDKFIEAEYNYMLHLRQHMLPEFNEKTKGFVWDTTHYYYDIIFKTSKKYDHEGESDKIKKIYRKLSKILHPDLCTYDNSTELFVIISQLYYEGNIDSLTNIENYIDNNNDNFSIKNYILNINNTNNTNNINNTNKADKETLIKEWKNSLWFNWFNPESFIKQIYVEPKIYYERLIVQNKKLKEKAKKLQEESEKLNKLQEKSEKLNKLIDESD